MEEQLERVRVQFESRASNIDKYIYLSSLQDRNEKLFYKFVSQNIEQTAPIVYTPTVGLACQKFGAIFRRPRSVFLFTRDKS
jgi:malate dehydrogenase (oxaloacetate-decarboxylating)(NADP+)